MYVLNTMVISDTYLRAMHNTKIIKPLRREGSNIQNKFSCWSKFIQFLNETTLDNLIRVAKEDLESEVKHIDDFFVKKTLPFVYKVLQDSGISPGGIATDHLSRLKGAHIRQYCTNYELHQTSGGFLSRIVKFITTKIDISKKKAKKLLAYVTCNESFKKKFKPRTKRWILSDLKCKTPPTFEKLCEKVDKIVKEKLQGINPFNIRRDEVHVCTQISARIHLDIMSSPSSATSKMVAPCSLHKGDKDTLTSKFKDKTCGFVAVPIKSNNLQFLLVSKSMIGPLFLRMLDHAGENGKKIISQQLLKGSGLDKIGSYNDLYKTEILLKNACELLNINTKFLDYSEDDEKVHFVESCFFCTNGYERTVLRERDIDQTKAKAIKDSGVKYKDINEDEFIKFSEKCDIDEEIHSHRPGDYVTEEDRDLIRDTMLGSFKQRDNSTRTRFVAGDPGQKMKMVGATDDGKIFKYSKKKTMERTLMNKHNAFEKLFRRDNAEYRNVIDSMPSLKEVTDVHSLYEALVGRTKAYFKLREVKHESNTFVKRKFERYCARLRTDADMARVAIHGICDIVKDDKSKRSESLAETKKKCSDPKKKIKRKHGRKIRSKRRTDDQNDFMKKIQDEFNKEDISEERRKKILRGAKQRYRRRNWSSEMKTWRRKKKRYRKWLVKLTKLEINMTEEEINEIMRQWEENNPNPANVVALVGIGKWMPACNCPLKGYPRTSFGRLHRTIDQHPRTMPVVGLMLLHESCTSKICSYCGGLNMNVGVKMEDGKEKKLHHVTRCTSVKGHENGKTCEKGGICRSRDIPGAEALLLCMEYEAKCLFTAKMKKGNTWKTWKDMTKGEMIQVRKKARQRGLPHYRPGRSMMR